MAVSGKNTMELIIAARDRTGGAFTKINSRVGKLGGTAQKVGKALKTAAKAGTLIGGAAVVAGIVGSTKAFMDFEDAMANVRKTTGMTKAQIGIMGEAINRLALDIPVAQTELAAIAATAGQLGIVGKKSIMSFTETVAKMTTAFDMSADDVAIAMAKLTNIYDIPIEQVGNLGSAINVLGNTTAASEAQLMAFSMSLGPTGQQLGFTATEALSLGASMVSIGMDASNAGTRLSRAFSMIGQNLDELAEFMGVSTEEFTDSFEDMPMETFMSILEKLSQVEGKLKANTVASELFNEIGAKAIKGLTGNLDGLKTNLISSAEGFEANTSLTEEFAAKTDTLKARFQLLKNSISGLLIDIGGELAPSLNQIIDGFRNIIPPLKNLIFEIGSGFGEMFESITRQAGSALDPLIEKVKETGDKISSGMNFKTLLDDIGVFIGAGLNPLIRGFTWLVDKLGPLWELVGKGAELFHNLANALKTEEGKLDDILDATEELTKAKQDLFNINEKLRGNVETLADSLEKAGGWTTMLADLEADAIVKTDALAVARLAASEAIAVHGANSEIAKTAIENVKLAEEAATGATNSFNTAVGIASQAIIDEGVATEELEQAQLDFTISTEDAIEGQENLVTAVADVKTELEEAKAAPFNLGEAFEDFGKLVARIFLAIPLKVAEGILSVQETISGGLEKIGLGGISKKLEADTDYIKGRIESIKQSLVTNIEEPLLEDIPKASDAMKDAVTGAAGAIVSSAKRAKEGVEGVNSALEEAEEAATDVGKAGERAFEEVEITVDEVSGKVTVLTDNLGDTADTFKENEEAAKTLLELDWEIFSKLKADLPGINAGIGDMKDTFSGLEVVLQGNLENLESIKMSIEHIATMSSPFTEAGFMNGIKSIGSFANILKDAGSAINTFSSLQEVSIDGMINFSLHVNDMVSALQILDSQMEDLMPAFTDMDLLIGNIAETFIYSSGKGETFTNDLISSFDSLYTTVETDLEGSGKSVKDFVDYVDKLDKEHTGWDFGFSWLFASTSENFRLLEENMENTAAARYDFINKLVNNYGVSYTQAAELFQKYTHEGKESGRAFAEEILSSAATIEFQMNKQTSALAYQTAQLKKITDALQPYLEFMRTLNELAALSTLSTEELNNGLNSINDTLINLGSALSTFDLASTMKSLFGTKITEGDMKGEFIGGFATPLLNVLEKFEVPFNNLVVYVTRLSSAISGLVSAFDTLANVGDSVLADQIKIKEVFESIVIAMSNFSNEMGKSGFGEKIAKGFEEMLTSAAPLIRYFKENNASVIDFNTTLLTFKTTLQNVINVMDSLKEISQMTVPGIKELTAGFDAASGIVKNFDKALMTHVGAREGQWDMDRYFNSIFESIKKFSADWDMLSSQMGKAPEAFAGMTSTITGIISNILSLTEAFKNLKDISVLSSVEMAAGFDIASEMISAINEGLMLHVGTGEGVWDVEKYFNSIFESIKKFTANWNMLTANMGETPETFGKITSTIIGMISNILSLTKAFTDLAAAATFSSAEMAAGFDNVSKIIRDVKDGLMLHIGAGEGRLNAEKYFNSVFESIKNFATDWDALTMGMEKSFETFGEGSTAILTMINNVVGLSKAFTDLGQAAVISEKDMEKAMGNMITFVGRFAVALQNNLKSIVSALIDVDTEWKKEAERMDEVLPSYTSAASSVGGIIRALGTLTSALKTLSEMGSISSTEFNRGFRSMIETISNFAVSLKANVLPLIRTLQNLRAVWLENEAVLVPLMVDFVIITKNFASMAINANRMVGAFKELAENSGSLEGGFKTLIKFIKDVVENTKEFYTPEAAAELTRFIEDVNKVIDSFANLDEKIATAVSGIKNKIVDAVGEIERSLLSLESLNKSMFNSGVNLMDSFINGIKSMQSALELAMIDVTDIIKAYLGVESPTELGALKNIEKWPRNLVSTFSKGIEAEMSGLNVSLSGMVAPAAIDGGGSNGNRTSVVFSVTQNIKDKATADYTTRELERMIQKHVV